MHLQDTQTSKQYPADLAIWCSPEGNLLDLQFDAQFEPNNIEKRGKHLWRYREALPIVNDKDIVSFEEGYTPMLKLNFEGKDVLIKQEQLFSSGSYKDRGATVLMSHAKSIGIRQIIQDSSGNAGCAIAAYAARAGIDCSIYLQSDTSPSKITQMGAYGAHLQFINGSREEVAESTLIAAQKIYYASHSWNPFFAHGTKTFAYEVCEQLGWKSPDSVVLPAGNGTLILGCYIGFMDLIKAGIISKIPKLIAIQSDNCAPLALAFYANQNDISAIQPKPTMAEGIAIAKPIRAQQILSCVKNSAGHFITVSENEIALAWRECASKGFYIEPTSAATIAGLKKYNQGFSNEVVVSLFSGHGLKSSAKIATLL
jgi:threonine synthase